MTFGRRQRIGWPSLVGRAVEQSPPRGESRERRGSPQAQQTYRRGRGNIGAAEENAGPLAAVSIETAFPQQTQSLLVRISDDEHERGEGYAAGEDGRGEVWEEVHEVLANLMLALVIVHVAGVALASFVHHENLAKAMVTGRKRAP